MLVNAVRVTLPPTGAQNWLLTPVVALTGSEIAAIITLQHHQSQHCHVYLQCTMSMKYPVMSPPNVLALME